MLLCMKVPYQAETSIRIWYKTLTPLTELGVWIAFLNPLYIYIYIYIYI